MNGRGNARERQDRAERGRAQMLRSGVQSPDVTFGIGDSFPGLFHANAAFTAHPQGRGRSDGRRRYEKGLDLIHAGEEEA